MEKLFLICNAHLDPVWQWEWEEGAGAALSTFRAAVDFCEEYDGLIFNHNEVILYQWVEEYEPELFERIKRLVQAGKWNIIGGWYLQPDCNMPCGESMIRQILTGQSYFKEKFGKKPTVAVNFDSFGHTKGLVQILCQAGYNGYICIRPYQNELPLPNREFVWKGFHNSEILVHRSDSYNSLMGKTREKIEKYLREYSHIRNGMVLWGVGNHGGGPSRIDLEAIGEMQKNLSLPEIVHSTPEAYFAALAENREELVSFDQSLNSTMIGCYTSQVRIKQKHSLLEHELYLAERMAVHAYLQTGDEYPSQQMDSAIKDLLFSEFHDILPGSSVKPVEAAAIRLLDHGLEEVSRVKARAFFRLAAGEKKAEEGEFPVLVYNPHPFEIQETVSCEFMLADQNWNEEFINIIVYQNGVRIPSQIEKENSNIPLQWRKKVTFYANLAPFTMNRFCCKTEVLPENPKLYQNIVDGMLVMRNSSTTVKINLSTGTVGSYQVDGIEYFRKETCRVIAIQDNEDPWGMNIKEFSGTIGEFTLMSPEAAGIYAGVDGPLTPVRVVEDGEVRTVVEALFSYGESKLCTRYILDKHQSRLTVSLKLLFQQNNCILKLSVPCALGQAKYYGKTVFGLNSLPTDGKEAAAQDYVLLSDGERAVSVINFGTYGSDCRDNTIRMSLVRSPAYCAHPIEDRKILPQDRLSDRIDLGPNEFSFIIQGGERRERFDSIEHESARALERPYALSYFPPQTGNQCMPLMTVSNKAIAVSALKPAEDGNGFILRLFNSTSKEQSGEIGFQSLGISKMVALGEYEVKTFRLTEGQMTETVLQI